MILEIKIDRKRIFLFFRLIIIPVTRYSSRLVRKDVARVKETLCFSPRVRWFDRYLWGDLYKQTHQRRGGLLEGNPRGRRYVHCVSSWNKQDVSLPIYPGDAGHHFSFQKNIPMGIEMNGPPPPSCCPPSLPEDVLDYCPRNNDSRNKNRPITEIPSWSWTAIDREEILSSGVLPIGEKDGDVSIKLSPVEILSKQEAIRTSNYSMNCHENSLPELSSWIILL